MKKIILAIMTLALVLGSFVTVRADAPVDEATDGDAEAVVETTHRQAKMMRLQSSRNRCF